MLIENKLISEEIGGCNAIDGVIVTTPIPDGRVKLGAQVVQMLVQHGFVRGDKWRNIILVGTKADRATREEMELFATQDVDEAGRPRGIAAQFFSLAPGGKGLLVTTSKGDYSQLRAAISGLPNMKVRYGAPEPARMAEAFAEKLGVDKEMFQQELRESRRALEAELAEGLAAQQRLREENLRLKREREEELERRTREADEQSRSLQQGLEANLEEPCRCLGGTAACRAHGARRAGAQGPELKEELEAVSQQAASCRETQQRQFREAEAKIRRLVAEQRQLEDANRQRARNYSFGSQSFALASSCLRVHSRRRGNMHGSGRKCSDCKAELGR